MVSTGAVDGVLTDREKIRHVVDEIYNAVDAKDRELYRSFFADEVNADLTSLAGGTNHKIVLYGGQAGVFSKGYVLDILRRPVGSDFWEVWGDYVPER